MLYSVVAAVVLLSLLIAALIAPRYARRLIRERHIRVERFKLKSRHTAIRDEVFTAPDVRAAIAAHAFANGVDEETAARTAKLYLAEILPKFNLLAYYRFGAPIASVLLNLLYRVVVARKTLRTFSEEAPKDAVVVYVINHRSNADYVLVAHMLFKFVSLSYAVGEWARVWPLNHLFKWFGAYFIRRRFREPLYHAVLAEFVRTITRNGVTQGFFIEGGLSRSGALQKPKLGMLDYILSTQRDERFHRSLYLIPTSINYDRTLEDRVLTNELLGKEDRPTGREKWGSTLQFLLKNSVRGIFGRFRRYGYAIVAFGAPISAEALFADEPTLRAPLFEDRKAALERVADRVLDAISAAVPITPVALVAEAFAGGGSFSEEEVERMLDGLQQKYEERVWLLRERRSADLWMAAKKVLELRHLIVRGSDDRWSWAEGEELLRQYYANSLQPPRRETVAAEGESRALAPQRADVPDRRADGVHQHHRESRGSAP